MREVFSKTAESNVSFNQQEFVELGLDDFGAAFRPRLIDSMAAAARYRFLVRVAHATWSEIDRNIIWDGFEHDECTTLEEAELRYAIRRGAIMDKGFIICEQIW